MSASGIRRFFIIVSSVLSMTVLHAQGIVTLSNLKVVEIADPAVHEVNRVMIEFAVSSPSSLRSLEIVVEHHDPSERISHSFSVSAKDGVIELNLPEYKAPFQERSIRFYMPVPDQLTSPFTSISIKGTDTNGLSTNQVTYQKTN